jgi:hypothetical protein
MVSFKKMWEDVNSLVIAGKFNDLENIKSYEEGFIVNNEGETMFLDSQDFIDFWCKMLLYREIDMSSKLNNQNDNFNLIYMLVRQLPYIEENQGKLTLMSSFVEKH